MLLGALDKGEQGAKHQAVRLAPKESIPAANRLDLPSTRVRYTANKEYNIHVFLDTGGGILLRQGLFSFLVHFLITALHRPAQRTEIPLTGVFHPSSVFLAFVTADCAGARYFASFGVITVAPFPDIKQ